eukprot:CFRG3911T1
MTRKPERKFPRTSAKSIVRWRHFAFDKVLINKAEYKGCAMIEYDQEYSSKTCGSWLCSNWKRGSDKTFNCSYERNCDYKAGRHANVVMNMNFILVSPKYSVPLVGTVRIEDEAFYVNLY